MVPCRMHAPCQTKLVDKASREFLQFEKRAWIETHWWNMEQHITDSVIILDQASPNTRVMCGEYEQCQAERLFVLSSLL